MRSILHHRFGPPDEVLALGERPDLPAPTGTTLIVRVTARPVHHGDLLGVRGRYQPPGSSPPAEPLTPGLEGAGVIDAVGADVDAAYFRVGGRVAFFPVPGAWSERVAVDARFAVPLPDAIDDTVAAQLHVNPLTAAMLIRATEAAGAGAGDVVLVSAAGSAVAGLLIAGLIERGIAPIGIVRRSSAAAALAETLGIPVIASDGEAWEQTLTTAIAGRPVKAGLDPVGGATGSAIFAQLSPGGTLICYGDLSSEPIAMSALEFPIRNVAIRGVSVSRWFEEPEAVRSADIEVALGLARDRPDLFGVAGVYGLEQIAEAARHVEATGRTGTVILR